MTLQFKDKNIKLRLFSEEDIPFLKKVYFSTREAEVNQVTYWNTEMKIAFLNQQFHAQHTYYQQNYTEAKFFVIERNKEFIGRLYYDEGFENTIRIIDIAILPEFQKKGLGTTILQGIFERAKVIEQPITIHVESFNPAMNLYKRLGFQKISETNGVYHLLQWNYKN
ncbi:acetyltransferase (GNAT) family protein [Arcicella aurantiaca]|uniref:Acetyltransferase (GNAT) family protein n=1 Tax=Arcicella aurantiaca TaxID=591202 RepID=A0A316EFM8_9BACT|nr:GNAT family N-acetyltransferase [Arcicella aurantiaca]PWK29072.1 acetyltransferase (GNAT) family protein [Arcicella aurantiaca]